MNQRQQPNVKTENRITSLQNTQVKRVVLLQQNSAERRRQGLFVVEGQRELGRCLAAGYEIEEVYFCPDLCAPPAGLPVVPVSREVYAKIACRDSTEGVVAVAQARTLTLDDLRLPVNPLIVVLERVEKPGNLGAVLRTADAAGVDAVVVCDPLTDLYNPNLIRSSIGAAFTVPCVACSSAQGIDFLKRNGITILTAQLQDSHLYYNTDMRGGTAIVMGAESTGLTRQWRQAADAHIRIPMLGALDSLNVSASAAILIFEAVRQRGGGSQ